MSQKFSLIWEDVNFIPEEALMKRLFSFLTCGVYFRPDKDRARLTASKGLILKGELVALMGPSGAGKSTLLKCLTLGKNLPGFEGKVIVQGLPQNVSVQGRIITQNDKEHLIPTLTVAESLRYSSKMKNKGASREEHEQQVEHYLNYLELADARDNLVERCSGGQTKRLAVGLELIALQKPHFLFLDEPTSGLDSDIGEKLIKILADCATLHGMTIITTIHQPKQSVMMLFSRVFILAGDGSIIYNQGPVFLPGFMAECGFNFDELRVRNKTYDSPTDVAIQIASRRKRKSNTQEHEDQLCRSMINKASLYSNPEAELRANSHLPVKIMEHGLCSIEANFSTGILLTLLCRTALTTVRHWRFIIIRLLLHAVVAGVLVCLYDDQIGKDSGCIVIDPQRDPRNCSCGVTIDDLQKETVSSTNVKFQFFSLLFLMFGALMPTVLTFPSEIKLFLHEYRNGLYSSITYYICKTLVEIPLQLIFPYVYCSFLYWYSHQPGFENWKGMVVMSDRFELFFFTTTLCCFIAQGLGFLIGILCVSSFNISIIVSSSALLFLFLFSGFFVRRNQMGPVATGVTYLSFIRFGFESIIISIFGQERCTLPEESSIMLTFSLEDHDVMFNSIMLGVHLVVMRLLALFFLKAKVSRTFLRSFRRGFRWMLGRCRICSDNSQERGYSDPCGIVKVIRYILWGCLCLLLFQLALGLIAGIIAAIIDATKGQHGNSTNLTMSPVLVTSAPLVHFNIFKNLNDSNL